MFKIVAPVALMAAIFVTPALADGPAKTIGNGLTETPTINAIPSDKAEMNDRELCIRRNMANYGKPTGDCREAPTCPNGTALGPNGCERVFTVTRPNRP